MLTISRIPTPFSYSRAVCAGDFVFLGLHRGFGATFEEQFEDVFRHLSGTLAECGSGLADLVKVNVWLKDVGDLPTMEAGFERHFEHDGYPARMTATTEFIDDDCLLMIEGTAYRPRSQSSGAPVTG